jgi:hypothetical protein
MVVLEAQVPKAFGNSFKSRAFGLIPERIVGVSAVNDFTKQYQCRVVGKIVPFQYCLERTLFAVVPQFRILNIEWCGAEALGFVNDFAGGDKEKFGMFVNELLYEPRTSHTIYFHFFSGDPFHNRSESSLRLLEERFPGLSRRVIRQLVAKQRRKTRMALS